MEAAVQNRVTISRSASLRQDFNITSSPIFLWSRYGRDMHAVGSSTRPSSLRGGISGRNKRLNAKMLSTDAVLFRVHKNLLVRGGGGKISCAANTGRRPA